ncbi:MAG: aldo/keto reductase [Pseudomonadota bacterium]
MTYLHRPRGPRLGFGTGALDGRKDRGQQIRLIHAALDAGICHFDTARLYGDGTAEGILGEALKGRRGDVFLVSKAGIIPPTNGTIRRAVNKALTLGGKLPGAGNALPRPRWNEPLFGQFEIETLRRSLERSLDALDTDYLDLFLLHEANAEHLEQGDVIEALERWRKEGLFVGYGIASTPDQTSRILSHKTNVFSTVQTAQSVFDSLSRPAIARDQFLITHSWLGAPFARFQNVFSKDPRFAERAGHVLYADVRRPHRLARCLLEYALHTNREGQVLFTTSKVERIEEMVRVAERPRMTEKQLESLAVVAKRIEEIEAEPA